MGATGRCHCGAIRYEANGDPVYHALCHCGDCRRATGAPVVSWALFPRDAVALTGDAPRRYASSANGERWFCGQCGSSLFYVNESVFPGMIDIQSATLDDPDAFPVAIHIQVAERIGWMRTAHELPTFDRYPQQE